VDFGPNRSEQINENIAAEKFHLTEIGLCGQVDGDQPGAIICLTGCADIEEYTLFLLLLWYLYLDHLQVSG